MDGSVRNDVGSKRGSAVMLESQNFGQDREGRCSPLDPVYQLSQALGPDDAHH